jgi:hypothetical protein
MTHTRQAIDRLSAVAHLLPRASAKLPSRSETAKVVEALRASDVVAAQPSGAALEMVRSRLIRASSVGDFSNLRRDLRDAAWLLWAEDRPLAGLAGLLDAVWSQAYKSNSTARALIEAWFTTFSPSDQNIANAGATIRTLLITRSNPRLDFWRNAERKVELFNAQRGPHKLASWLINGPEAVAEILLETGFADPLRGVSNFMRAVQRELLSIISALLTQPVADEALRRRFCFSCAGWRAAICGAGC